MLRDATLALLLAIVVDVALEGVAIPVRRHVIMAEHHDDLVVSMTLVKEVKRDSHTYAASMAACPEALGKPAASSTTPQMQRAESTAINGPLRGARGQDRYGVNRALRARSRTWAVSKTLPSVS
jgi:hypothetical protein